MSETVADLLDRCNAARKAGVNFPAVWNSILKGHPLVLGLPVQKLRGTAAALEIRLLTGQRLLFDERGYSLA